MTVLSGPSTSADPQVYHLTSFLRSDTSWVYKKQQMLPVNMHVHIMDCNSLLRIYLCTQILQFRVNILVPVRVIMVKHSTLINGYKLDFKPAQVTLLPHLSKPVQVIVGWWSFRADIISRRTSGVAVAVKPITGTYSTNEERQSYKVPFYWHCTVLQLTGYATVMMVSFRV